MKERGVRIVACYCIIAMCVLGITPPAHAGFVQSQLLAGVQSNRGADLQEIQSFLERKVVKNRLQQLGFSCEEIEARVSLLDDQQINTIAGKAKELRVGGDGLGVVIAVLVIAILVVVLLRLVRIR